MSVARCSLFVDWCLLFGVAVCCPLFVVRCLLVVGWLFLFCVCVLCLMCVVCRALFDICCFPVVVHCLRLSVCCLLL